MAYIATKEVPSTSNLQGGLAGLAATLAVGFLTHAGYIAIAAAAVGIPEASMAVVATGIIATIAKVAVSHIAELKEADGLIKSVQDLVPNTYSAPSDFPNPPPVVTPNNLNNGGK
jgi:hypothetical protein